jgi:hypothetical protein
MGPIELVLSQSRVALRGFLQGQKSLEREAGRLRAFGQP